MNKQSEAKAYSWLRNIEKNILEASQIPLLPALPPFPWEKFANTFARELKLKNFQVTPQKLEVTPLEELLKIEASATLIKINLLPLVGSLYFKISEQDLNLLLSNLLTENDQITAFLDLEFQKSFAYFLAVETSLIIKQMQIFPTLFPQITLINELPFSEPSLCQDLLLSIGQTNCLAKLIIPETDLHELKQHYLQQKPLPSKVAADLQLPLTFQAGKVTLSYQEWSTLRQGDFIILDESYFDPTTQKGFLSVILNEHPIFKAEICQEGLKLFQHEVAMTAKTPSPDNLKNNLVPNSPLPTEAESLPLTELQNLPLPITIEVARLTLPAQKILELQPGNILDLSLSIDSLVSLTVNGTCLGKGELIRIGDTLGVRITQLG